MHGLLKLQLFSDVFVLELKLLAAFLVRNFKYYPLYFLWRYALLCQEYYHIRLTEISPNHQIYTYKNKEEINKILHSRKQKRKENMILVISKNCLNIRIYHYLEY